MKHSLIAPALKDVSQIEFADSTYWLRIPLSERTGTSVYMSGRDENGEFSDVEIPITNGAAGNWDASGYFESLGNNGTAIDRDLSSIFRTDTLDGTILIMHHFGKNSGVGTGDHVISYGNPFGDRGYGIRFYAGRQPDFGICLGTGDNDQATASVSFAYPDTATDVEPVLGWIYRDATGNPTECEFGLYKGATSLASETTEHLIYRAGLKTAIFGRANDAGTIVAQCGANPLVADILVIRTPVDLRPYLGEIGQEQWYNKWEMLRTLQRLGV